MPGRRVAAQSVKVFIEAASHCSPIFRALRLKQISRESMN
jgi:hypothetical protein